MIALDPGARRAILDACDALRADSVATLERLVRCASTLGNEASALEEIEVCAAHRPGILRRVADTVADPAGRLAARMALSSARLQARLAAASRTPF
jgi:acetylornithine deacetylase